MYAVGYADLDPQTMEAAVNGDAQAFWQGLRSGVLQNGQSQLLREQPISLNGYEGREIEYKDANGLIGKVRIYLVDQRIYQIMTLTAQETPLRATSIAAETFLDSFQLLQDP